MWSTMRFCIAVSGKEPRAAAMFSTMWSTRDVAEMEQDAPGYDKANFGKNYDHMRAPNPAANSSDASRRVNRRPFLIAELCAMGRLRATVCLLVGVCR